HGIRPQSAECHLTERTEHSTVFIVHTIGGHIDNLWGLPEIAQFARVTRAAVGNWRFRFEDFPKPVAELSAGPVFRRDQVISWLKRRRVKMATVIALINLKGGVAKSTTTVATAQMLDVEFGKRVLVIDIDPQTNGTMMLIGDKKW